MGIIAIIVGVIIIIDPAIVAYYTRNCTHSYYGIMELINRGIE